jgi:hypothetical protein
VGERKNELLMTRDNMQDSCEVFVLDVQGQYVEVGVI